MPPSRRFAVRSEPASVLGNASRPPRATAMLHRITPEFSARPSPTDRSQHLVLLEPVRRLRPRILGRVLAVARPIIGMETVRRARIDLELGSLARSRERRLHRLDLRDRDALVGFAIESEPGRLHLGGRSEEHTSE